MSPRPLRRRAHVASQVALGALLTLVAPRLARAGGSLGSAAQPVPFEPDERRTPTEEEPSGPRFGRRGQIVVSGQLDLNLGFTWTSDDPRRQSHASVTPSMDAFVSEDVSLGAFLSYGVSASRDYADDGTLTDVTSHGGSLGARLGFNEPIGKWVSWWPRLSLGWSTTSTSVRPVDRPSFAGGKPGYDAAESGMFLILEAPLLLHPAPHWFLGVGPTLYRDLARSREGSPLENNRTTLGFTYVVGGYL